MRRRFISNKSVSNNIIRYTSTDGNIVIPYKIDFGTSLISNTYNDEGLMVFKSNVTSIGNFAFYSCTSLKSIQIPNSVTSIEDEAFYYCTSLKSIQIPNSVTSIGEWAFSRCSGLTSIVVDFGNSKYDSRNGCNAIIETASNTLIAGCQNTIIPNSITSIGEGAFNGRTSLTSIEIPNSVTSIEDEAFYGCSSLTSIQIPNRVTSIEYGAFRDCSSLTSIQIPNSVTSIGERAFNSCSSLKSVYIKAATPPTLGAVVFDSNASDRKIYVPRASVDTYKTAEGWSEYADAIEPYDY